MRAPRTSLTGGLVDVIASSSTGTRCSGGKSSAIAAAGIADNAATAINAYFIYIPPDLASAAAPDQSRKDTDPATKVALGLQSCGRPLPFVHDVRARQGIYADPESCKYKSPLA